MREGRFGTGRVRPVLLVVGAASLGLLVLLLALLGFSTLLAESGRDRPPAVARIGGRLVILQKACPGEEVANADVSPANTTDLDSGKRVVRVRARYQAVGPQRDGAIHVPIETSDTTWIVAGRLPEERSTYWVDEVQDEAGRGFSYSVVPFVPAEIDEGMAMTSDHNVVPLDQWLAAKASC